LDQLKQIGLDDVRERIVTETMVTPADWQSQYDVYRGATFNLAHGLDQMLHLRPHNRFEDLESVYLVGGGTHPGSGLPVIYESSRITCKEMLPRLGLDTQFIQATQGLDHLGAPKPDEVARSGLAFGVRNSEVGTLQTPRSASTASGADAVACSAGDSAD
jgi:phytoene desaturase